MAGFDVGTTTHDYMSIVLTHRCNLACPFCVDDYRGRNEDISESDYHKALSFAIEHDIRDVLLIGGEPTLHPQVEEFCVDARLRGLRVIMTTNYASPRTRWMVHQLDGHINCLNVSVYEQGVSALRDLGSLLKTEVTLHKLIYLGGIDTRARLDSFIDELGGIGNLKFSTLLASNPWARDHQPLWWLDELEPCEWFVLFNELLGQRYRGAVIKRYDRIINKHAHQSFKAHVDGSITQTWDRPGLTKWWEKTDGA